LLHTVVREEQSHGSR